MQTVNYILEDRIKKQNIMMKNAHTAVMLEEAIAGLNIKQNGTYIDATYGRGGHSRAILERLGANGRLIVLDQDPQAIADASQLANQDGRVSAYHAPFNQLQKICQQADVFGKVDGILFDLGVSSPQLDEADRGFSFMRDGQLDMRMNPEVGQSAAEWLATASVKDIAYILKTLGEERFSQRIATAIVNSRAQQPITTTLQLVDIIKRAIPFQEKHKHPATRTFLALRVYINQELEVLAQTLTQVVDILAEQGRLVVISFHSLEDRIVKQFIVKNSTIDNPLPYLPIIQPQILPKIKKVGKAQQPTVEEIQSNVRARSAVLRVAEKLPRNVNAKN